MRLLKTVIETRGQVVTFAVIRRLLVPTVGFA